MKMLFMLSCLLFASMSFAVGDNVPAGEFLDADVAQVSFEAVPRLADVAAPHPLRTMAAGENTQPELADEAPSADSAVVPLPATRLTTKDGKVEVGWRLF